MTPEQFAELQELEEMERLEAQLAKAQGPTSLGRLKAAGSGAAEGAIASTVGLGGDLASLIKAGRSAMTPESWQPFMEEADKYNPMARLVNALPSTKGIMEKAGVDYEPKDESEAWIKRLVSGGVGGALAGPRALSGAARGLTGMISGGAAETAKQAGLGAPGEIAASILPWAGAGALAARTPNVVKTVQPAVQAVGEPAIREAARSVAEKGRTLGERMLLTQGFPEDNALTAVARQVAGEPGGQQLGAIVGRQGASARDLAHSMVQRMDPGPDQLGMSRALESSQQSGNWMKSFTDRTIGRESAPYMQTKQNFADMMRQDAIAQGRAPREVNRYVREATELMEAIQAASRNRDFMTALNKTGFQESLGRNILSEGMRSANLIAPLWRAGSALERAVGKESVKQLARAFSTPGGEEMLIRIANFNPTDHKVRELIRALAASRAGAGTAGQ